MKDITLYMDNYRGFNDTLITLEDVNFLVGENSSGKSTMISLLKTMMSSSFWAHADMNSEKEESNTFEEYVNQYSEKRDYFIVGITGEEKKPFHILLKYRSNDDGLPELCEYKCYKDGISIKVVLYPEIICLMKDEKNPNFYKWIHDNDDFEENEKFKDIVMARHLFPFIVHLNVIYNILKLGENIKEISSFDMPVSMRASWIEPIRAKAKSLYSSVNRKFSDDGAHIPVVLKNNEDNAMLKKKLDSFGRKSNLFDSIEIDTFGSEQHNAPFSVKVAYDDVRTNINEVGQGVNQILPIIVECYMRKKYLLSIQQPEVHLHPKAQAAFGEVLYDVSRGNYENKLLIETHSDYTIDRYRYMINQKGEKKKKTQLLFFVRTKKGNIIKSIKICEDGSFPDNMPKEYGKFFVDEELRMLSV